MVCVCVCVCVWCERGRVCESVSESEVCVCERVCVWCVCVCERESV